MSDSMETPLEDMVWDVIHLRSKTQSVEGLMVQKSPFIKGDQLMSQLDLEYVIRPEGEWKLHVKYARVVVGPITYRTGDFIFVKSPNTGASKAQPNEEADVRDCWVAKILEIRAADEEHVYARVFWMYWPTDLPVVTDCGVSARGARSYHGTHELIASNHMNIINVSTFAGPATVRNWCEDADDGACQDALYWRQTYDYRTRQLSSLQRLCTCGRYYNPDKIIISCPNKECNIWLHAECLIDDILTKKFPSLDGIIKAATSTLVMRKRKNKKRKLTTVKKPYVGIFSAEIIGEENDLPLIEITDLRPNVDPKSRKWKESIMCPKCDTKIE